MPTDLGTEQWDALAFVVLLGSLLLVAGWIVQAICYEAQRRWIMRQLRISDPVEQTKQWLREIQEEEEQKQKWPRPLLRLIRGGRR